MNSSAQEIDVAFVEGFRSLFEESIATIERESGREAMVEFIYNVKALVENQIAEARSLNMNLTTKEEQIAADLSAKFYRELEGQDSRIVISAAGSLLGRLLGEAYKTEDETIKQVRLLSANLVRIARFWRTQIKAKQN